MSSHIQKLFNKECSARTEYTIKADAAKIVVIFFEDLINKNPLLDAQKLSKEFFQQVNSKLGFNGIITKQKAEEILKEFHFFSSISSSTGSEEISPDFELINWIDGPRVCVQSDLSLAVDSGNFHLKQFSF